MVRPSSSLRRVRRLGPRRPLRAMSGLRVGSEGGCRLADLFSNGLEGGVARRRLRGVGRRRRRQGRHGQERPLRHRPCPRAPASACEWTAPLSQLALDVAPAICAARNLLELCQAMPSSNSVNPPPSKPTQLNPYHGPIAPSFSHFSASFPQPAPVAP